MPAKTTVSSLNVVLRAVFEIASDEEFPISVRRLTVKDRGVETERREALDDGRLTGLATQLRNLQRHFAGFGMKRSVVTSRSGILAALTRPVAPSAILEETVTPKCAKDFLRYH